MKSLSCLSIFLLFPFLLLAQIHLLKDIHPSNRTYPDYPFYQIKQGYNGGIQIGDYLYFRGNDSIHGLEPWITDGTPEGTQMIADLYPGMQNPYQTGISNQYAIIRNFLFQRAIDTSKRHSIWVYDISDPGNPQVFGNVKPDTLDRWTINSEIIAFGDHIYFAASDRGSSSYNVELWRADEQGVELFADINATLDSRSSSPSNFFVFNNHLYFLANNDTIGRELWRTDGQTIELFKDFNPDGGSNIFTISELNGEMIFSLYNGEPNGSDQFGYALWKSDGTPTGTEMIYDFVEEQASQNFLSYQGNLYFWANDSVHGFELWRTDGTTPGTYMLKDMETGSASSLVQSIPAANGTMYGKELGGILYFRRFASASSDQIWKTDGTSSGTQSAANDWISPFLMTYKSGYPVEFQGKYIGVSGGSYPEELIWSDGSPGSTSILEELMPGNDPTYPTDLWVLGDRLVFSAQDPVHGFELRVMDLNAVDVEEQLTILPIEIFPNPGNNLVHIHLPDWPQADLTKIQLKNPLGQVMTVSIQGLAGRWEIHTQNLPSGLYLIEVLHPTQAPLVKKWIKE